MEAELAASINTTTKVHRETSSSTTRKLLVSILRKWLHPAWEVGTFSRK